jgi:hypothetical protein
MAAAAAVLLAAGAGALFVALGGSQTSEASDVMDRLVDWNLTMAGTDSLADRDRLYTAQAQELERQVRQGRLSANEQELAASLLDNSARLARDADPLAEAEGFTDVATVLVRQMGHAATKGDVGRTKGLNRYYARLVPRGVNAKIDRLDPAAPPLPERDRKLEKLLQRNAELRAQLTSLLETSPAATHEEIRRALDVPAPKRRKGR